MVEAGVTLEIVAVEVRLTRVGLAGEQAEIGIGDRPGPRGRIEVFLEVHWVLQIDGRSGTSLVAEQYAHISLEGDAAIGGLNDLLIDGWIRLVGDPAAQGDKGECVAGGKCDRLPVDVVTQQAGVDGHQPRRLNVQGRWNNRADCDLLQRWVGGEGSNERN